MEMNPNEATSDYCKQKPRHSPRQIKTYLYKFQSRQDGWSPVGIRTAYR